MKITISPTEDQSIEKFPYFTVSVEHPQDDGISIEHAVDMSFLALKAWGFDAENIAKAFHDFIP